MEPKVTETKVARCVLVITPIKRINKTPTKIIFLKFKIPLIENNDATAIEIAKAN